MVANLVFKNGFFQTKSRSFNSSILRKALSVFIEKDAGYKSKFLQKEYGYGFDGYSYLGQEDSSNQYASDRLHSFVISDFTEPENFPIEFKNFFDKEWHELQLKIKDLELEMIQKMEVPNLREFYEKHIGHMISCNFYPPVNLQDEEGRNNVRLSAHKDVSLFTIFPFGFDSDFYFENATGDWVNIPATDDIVIFPGFLMEFFTKGKVKALNHKVAMPKINKGERFSFAYFSLPYPNHKFKIDDKEVTSEGYFKTYLDLF